jgi:hypothetical protein
VGTLDVFESSIKSLPQLDQVSTALDGAQHTWSKAALRRCVETVRENGACRQLSSTVALDGMTGCSACRLPVQYSLCHPAILLVPRSAARYQAQLSRGVISSVRSVWVRS